MFDSYVAAKLSEAWTQTPHSDFTSWSADQGSILENEARPWLSLETGADFTPVGLITTDNSKAGCSPDGMAGEIGAEIKCLQPTHHVKVLLGRKLPDEFAMQVHGGMYVTGFRSWLFCAYARRYPKLVITVQRDEQIQAAIAEALEAFNIAFSAGWESLCELNGGPPRQPSVIAKEKPTEFTPTTQDSLS